MELRTSTAAIMVALDRTAVRMEVEDSSAAQTEPTMRTAVKTAEAVIGNHHVAQPYGSINFPS